MDPKGKEMVVNDKEKEYPQQEQVKGEALLL
jgi:hypothetical protein